MWQSLLSSTPTNLRASGNTSGGRIFSELFSNASGTGTYYAFAPGLYLTAAHNIYRDLPGTGPGTAGTYSSYSLRGLSGGGGSFVATAVSDLRNAQAVIETFPGHGYNSPTPAIRNVDMVLIDAGGAPASFEMVGLGAFVDPSDVLLTDFTVSGYPNGVFGNVAAHPTSVSPDGLHVSYTGTPAPIPGISGSPFLLELGVENPLNESVIDPVFSIGVQSTGQSNPAPSGAGAGPLFLPSDLQLFASAVVAKGIDPNDIPMFHLFGASSSASQAGLQLDGTAIRDAIIGGVRGEVIDGGDADDVLFGGAGDDTFIAHDGDGQDIIHGGDNSMDGSSLASGGGGDMRGEADGKDTINYDGLSSGIIFSTSVLPNIDAKIIHNGGLDYLISIEKISATSYSDDFSFGPDQSRNASFYVDAGAEADLADYLGFDSSVSGIDFDISEELIDGIATSAIVVSRPTSAGSATDTLVNFEFVTGSDGVNKFNLSGTYSGYSDLHLDGAGGDDIFTVTDSSFVALNGATLDGGAGIDTLDLSAMGNGVVATIGSNQMSLRSTGQSSGGNASSEVGVENIEKFVGTQFVDAVDVKVAGLRVTSGEGGDHVNFASALALFADASADDHIYYNGTELKGVLGWGDAMEKASLFSPGEGVTYSINQDSELIIEGVGGQQIFVAGFQSGPDAKYDTAGIRLAIAQLTAYQLLDPDYPGGKALIDGFGELMDEIRARFLDEEVVGVDPLVLDLDGDGLELSARSSISPMFDIDNDGFSERSGWVFGGDGFLAIDANNDGIINDVSELFGDASVSGFDELASYDLNLDGVIDSADTVFADLKVWVDVNGDAQTDAGELVTLSELGIVSITLPGTPGSPVIQAGNTIAASSSFTLAGGETRAIADVRFNVDQVNTEFLGDTTVSATAALLPELNGAGELPSLHIAATLAPELVNIVQTAASGANQVDLVGLAANVRPMLNSWAAGDYTAQGAGAEPAELPYDIHYQYAINESGGVDVVRYIYSDAHMVDDVLVVYYKSTSGSIPAADPVSGPTQAEALAWLQSEAAQSGSFVGTFGSAEVETLERFTGADVPLEEIFGDSTSGPLNSYALGDASLDQREAVREFIEAHANLEVRSGVSLAVQSGLAAYFPEVSYDTEDGVFISDTAGDLQAAYLAILNDAPTNSTDAIDYLADWAPVLKVFLSQYARGDSHLVNSYSYQFGNLVKGYEAHGTFPVDIASAATALGIPGVVANAGTSDADIFYVSNGDEFLNGGEGVDSYVFGNNFGDVIIDDREAIGENSAPDNLRFAVHDSTDVVATRDGNDLILTFAATGQSVTVNDQFLRERFSSVGTRLDDDRGVVEIVFADGVVWDEFDITKAVSHPDAASETIVGTRHVDWLDGGAGDDVLEGGNSTDIYIFGTGYGHDTIHEYGPDLTGDNGIFILLEGDDFVRFGDGITLDDLEFSRDGNSDDLVITISATGETLTIVDQFVATNTGPFGVFWFDRVENFSFDEEGSIISWEDVLRDVVVSTSGNDTIYGFYYQDILDGGEGDDFLSGGDESDVYYFGLGDGSDTIEEGQTNVLTASLDKIVFKEGISVEDVTFTHDGATNDLIVSINGTSDQIRIVDQYTVIDTGPYGLQAFDLIEYFEWADGTVKVWGDLRQEIIDASQTDGDDVIYGTYLDDLFEGGLGNDELHGGSGSDTYVFTSGDGNDTINDYLSNILAGDDDRIVFTDLNASDLTLSRGGVLHGGDLILTHAASGSSITIEGQFEYTTLQGIKFNEIETIEFANGQVWSLSDIRQAWLDQNSTAGNDTIDGFATDDTIIGGAGDDILAGGDGSDTYVFNLGDGVDTIRESVGYVTYDDEDVLQFGAGLTLADVQFTHSGDDLIISFAGKTEQVTIEGQFTSAAYFGSWTDIETFSFDAGADVLTNLDVQSLLLGAQSTSGDDTITGFFTADTLSGGLGNDTLKGSTGGDTYLFDLGDGNDTIIESVDDHLFLDGQDRIKFGAGIARSDVTFSIVGDDFLVSIAGGDSILIQDYAIDENRKVELFEFADGTLLTATEAENNALASQATTGDDVISGTSGSDTLQGGQGNDTLHGLDGSDTFVFTRGDGIDLIDDNGYFDTDTLLLHGYTPGEVIAARGGASNGDLILTFAGTSDQITIPDSLSEDIYDEVEQIVFDDGTVWNMADIRQSLLEQAASDGNDVIEGFVVSDLLEGGLGDDVLHGGDGSDTYVFSVGDGQDEIEDNGYFSTDRLVIHGYETSDLILTASGASSQDLIITFAGTADQVTIRDTLNNGLYDDLEQIVFDDGTIWTMADVRRQILSQRMTTGDDIIEGFAASDLIEGGPGNDVLHGLDGSDTYVFSVGDGQGEIEDNGYFSTDRLVIHGYETSDLILTASGASSQDLIITFAGTADQVTIRDTLNNGLYDDLEQIVFDDGTIWTMADVRRQILSQRMTTGDDIIEGFAASDLIEGGPGNDVLHGLDGSDTYVFTIGDGQDEIKDNGYLDTDRLVIHGYEPADVFVSATGANSEDLIMTFAGSADQIIDRNTLNEHYNDEIEQIVFDDGTVWTMADVRSFVVQQAATAGDDIIEGFDFADTIEGGLGNDVLHGLEGSDTYVFTIGDGQDEIEDNGYSNTDKLVLHGCDTADVFLAASGASAEDLVITFAGSTDQIAIRNTLNENTNDQIEQIVFDDGTIWSMADVRSFILEQQSTSGDDVISGLIWADTLEGGAGNDVLHGLDGSDTYVFSAGDGIDEIEENGNGDNDRLLIHDYLTSEVTLERGPQSVDDLVISFDGSTDQITIRNTLDQDPEDHIEFIEFDDGTIWQLADMLALLAPDNSGNDIINGTGGNDILEGGLGDDELHGGYGSDTYVFSLGDGVDQIEDNGGGDTDVLRIHDYTTSDVIVGRGAGASDDLILTFAGTSDQVTVWNTLNGGWGDPLEQVVFDDATVWTMGDLRVQLLAQASTTGNDTIYGFNSSDTLEGGLSDDSLYGGSGSDTYVFSLGDGVDQIEDNGGGDTDVLRIHDYTTSDIQFARVTPGSDDLLITFTGTSDQITVWNTLNGGWGDPIEQIEFDDGTIWTMSDVNNILNGLAPIIFDLDGDGQYISDTQVTFDYDDDTRVELGAWMDPGDGVLALDRNGNGIIDSGAEISFVDDLPGAQTDLEGLSAFDTNGDGELSSSDAGFGDFLVWNDVNLNGVSEVSELMPLASAGISSISLEAEAHEGDAPAHGAQIFGETSVHMSDGSEIQAADAQLSYREVEEGSPQTTLPFGISKLFRDGEGGPYFARGEGWNWKHDFFGFRHAQIDAYDDGASFGHVYRATGLEHPSSKLVDLSEGPAKQTWSFDPHELKLDFDGLSSLRDRMSAVHELIADEGVEDDGFDHADAGWLESFDFGQFSDDLSHEFQRLDFDHHELMA